MSNAIKMIIAAMVLLVCLMFTGCANPTADFHQAVMLGDVEQAEAMLIEEPTLVEAEVDGLAPIFEAIREDQKHMLIFLIDNGADVNAEDEYGYTPLHYAALQGYTEIAELLTAKGANINAKSFIGDTPLHLAATGGHNDAVISLLAAGAEVDAENQLQRTPLHFAAKEGHLDVARTLLGHGANVNAKDKSPGSTPLHYAAQQNHRELARLLINEGADVNARDLLSRTPMYWAAVRVHQESVCEDVVELLQAHGGR